MNNRVRATVGLLGAGVMLALGTHVALADPAYPPAPPKNTAPPPIVTVPGNGNNNGVPTLITDPSNSSSGLASTGFQATDAAAIGIALLAGGIVVTVAARRKGSV